MPTAMSVAIVGAGIGGLTAALELKRAGFSVAVYERRTELAEVNTGFLLWSFAIARLRALGLAEGIERIGEPLTRLTTWSWRGRLLSDISLEELNAGVGVASYDVHRAGLQSLLADAVGREDIHVDAACSDLHHHGGRPAIVLARSQPVEADLIVGADGVNSVVRDHVAPPATLRRESIGIWRGVAEIGTEVIPAGHHIRIMGPAGLFGVGRLDEQTVRWYAGTTAPEGTPADAEARRRLASAHFGDWPEPAPIVIDRTEADALLYNDAPRLSPLRRWRRGPVVLLGDAAHPTLPTLASGGGMAIADAAALRESLVEHDDLDTGLAAYERARRRTTARIQREALGFAGVLGIRNRLLLRMRDFAFRWDWPQRIAIEHLMRGGARPSIGRASR